MRQYLIGLCCSALLLSGCGSDTPNTGDLNQIEGASLEGVISPLVLDFGSTATHELTTANGIEVPLRSTVVSLSNYSGDTVRVVGTESINGVFHVDSLVRLRARDSLSGSAGQASGVVAWSGFEAVVPASWSAGEAGCLKRGSGAQICVHEGTGDESVFDSDQSLRILGTTGWKQVNEAGEIYIGVVDRPTVGDIRIFSLTPGEDQLRESAEFYDILVNLHPSQRMAGLIGESQQLTACDDEVRCPSGYTCKASGFEEGAKSYCTNARSEVVNALKPEKHIAADSPESTDSPAEDVPVAGPEAEQPAVEPGPETQTPQLTPVPELNEYTLERLDYYFSVPAPWYFQQIGNQVQTGPAAFDTAAAQAIYTIELMQAQIDRREIIDQDGTVTIREPRSTNSAWILTAPSSDRNTLLEMATRLRDKEAQQASAPVVVPSSTQQPQVSAPDQTTDDNSDQ